MKKLQGRRVAGTGLIAASAVIAIYTGTQVFAADDKTAVSDKKHTIEAGPKASSPADAANDKALLPITEAKPPNETDKDRQARTDKPSGKAESSGPEDAQTKNAGKHPTTEANEAQASGAGASATTNKTTQSSSAAPTAVGKPADAPSNTESAHRDDSAYREMLKNGAAAYRQKDYDAANKLLAQALVEAEKFGKDDQRVPPVLNVQALVASMKQDYKGAIDLQKRAQAVNTKQYGANSTEVAYDLAHLSLWYEASKQPADAEAALKQSVEVTEKAVGKDDVRLAQALEGLGGFYLKHQRVKDAEPAMKRALDIYAKAGKDRAAKEMTAKLADLYSKEGKSKEVEQLYQQEIAREEKDLGADSTTLSVTLSSVAELYMNQGHCSQAEPLLRRALSIQRAAMGQDSAITAVTSFNLAACLAREGKYSDADPMYKEAIRVLSNSRHKDELGEIMSEYASCLAHLGRKADAARLRAQRQANH
jgi:tetratricopeptide (TPR) repeat protein